MSAFSTDVAPYGPSASGIDFVPVAAPGSDVAQVGRAFVAQAAGVVSVRTEAGNPRTFTAIAGQQVPVAITHVLAATAVDLLVII